MVSVVGGLMVRNDRPSFDWFFPLHLERLMPLIDHLYVRIDKTGGSVVPYLEPYGDRIHWDWQHDHPNNNHLEHLERQAILDWGKSTGAEWMFCFDSDEVLEEGAAEVLRQFVDADPPYRVLMFPLTYCSHHREGYLLDRDEPDEGQGVVAGRGFRLSAPELQDFQYVGDEDGLHCGTLPFHEKRAARLREIITVHYHACTPEEWQHKRDFYDNTEEVRRHGGIDWLYRCDRFGKEENAKPYDEVVTNRERRFRALMKRLKRAA